MSIARDCRIHIFICILMCAILASCAKRADVRHIDSNEASQFPNSKSQSDKWYKDNIAPLVKGAHNKDVSKEYEGFAKIYVNELGTMDMHTRMHGLGVFTQFLRELLQEYIFLQKQGSIAPWNYFSSNISLDTNVESSDFTAKVFDSINSQDIEYLRDLAYSNADSIMLLYNISAINTKYLHNDTTSKDIEYLTGIQQYRLSEELYSLLQYRILYAKYMEKFQSSYLLSQMQQITPTQMLYTTKELFDARVARLHDNFRIYDFDPTNPIAIMQCKAGSSNYSNISACIDYIYKPWIEFLRKHLNTYSMRDSKQYILPIYTEDKLCLAIGAMKILQYRDNNAEFCNELYRRIR